MDNMNKETNKILLCRDCKHCKGARVGYVSHRYWCSLTGDGWNNRAIGVYPWLNKPHPKCPLGLVDTLPKGKRKTKKEVKGMEKTKKYTEEEIEATKKHVEKELDRIFNNDRSEMEDFCGTTFCDWPCENYTADCPKGCALFEAVKECRSNPSNENLNEVKSVAFQFLNKKIK